VGRIADEAAVNQNLIAAANWYEQAGNGHGGTHGLRQAAVAEDNFMATDQIGGDAAIGNRQMSDKILGSYGRVSDR